MVFQKISQRVISLAKQRGISKYRLARSCNGVSPSTVYNVMSGKRSMKVETLVYICETLEISLKDFFDWDGDVDYNLSIDEKMVIEAMRNMDEKQLQRLIGYVSSLIEMRK